MSVFNGLVDCCKLLSQIFRFLLGLCIIISPFLLLLLFALLLLFLLLSTAFLLHRVLELDVHRDLIELLEISRYRDLDNRGIVLQVKQELVQVDVHARRSRVEEHQIFLHLTYAANCGLQHSLYVNAFLGMDHLVVAFFQFPVDVDILHVETR